MASTKANLTHRGKDFQGNIVKRAALEIRSADPAFGDDYTSPDVYGPAQQWFRAFSGQICWFDEQGNTRCSGTLQPVHTVQRNELPNSAGSFVLPTVVPAHITHVMLDLIEQDGDFSLDDWAPTSTGPNVEFRIRKLNNDNGKIIWTDPDTGDVYEHVNRHKEFITLIWDMALEKFSVA